MCELNILNITVSNFFQQNKTLCWNFAVALKTVYCYNIVYFSYTISSQYLMHILSLVCDTFSTFIELSKLSSTFCMLS